MMLALRRISIFGICTLLQISITMFLYLLLGDYFTVIGLIYRLLSIRIALEIVTKSTKLSSDMPWIIIILMYPIIGTFLYIVVGKNKRSSKLLKNINKTTKESKKYLTQDEDIKNEILSKKDGPLKYMIEYANYPVTKNNEIEYFPLGDEAFPKMLEELNKAKKYIFMEYFIIEDGKMWDSIFSILKRKVKEGVEVRFMYDDVGSITKVPGNYDKYIKSFGIKCVKFNELKPFAGAIMNNRDHRKMTIIDGKIAFSGGINLADEYININSKFGHWKDNSIMLKGDAVWTFTVMFLELWNSIKNEDSNYLKFKGITDKKIKSNGYTAPYGISPLDEENIGEEVYLNIINEAKDYIYIYTPYLIIDTDLINALVLASKRGVDIKIVVPGIPDKKLIYELTKSYFDELIQNKIEIYTYEKGFVHSKVFISDGKVATVGTINLDYRSLYLHFECGIYMKNTEVIKDIYNDITETIKISKKQTIKKQSKIKKLAISFLRLFAPLL